jgi:predicted nucleotidyltransferase component of viral defense system
MNNLDQFKSDVARLFFSLPASDGYVLAGGGALLASGLSHRHTEDLDFCGHRETRQMAIVGRIFELAATREGWNAQPIRRSEDFVRLQIKGSDTIAIDICQDTRAIMPVNHSSVGPTYSGPELACRKMLALFSRAEARDFVDVFVLAGKFGRDALFTQTKTLDAGFGPEPFCEAIARLALFDDVVLPISRELVPELREFFRSWAEELSA